MAPSPVSQWYAQYPSVTTQPLDPVNAVRLVRCVVMATDSYRMGRAMSTPKTPARSALVRYNLLCVLD